MPDSNKTAIQLLEELKKERDELNFLIQSLEKRAGVMPDPKEGEAATSSGGQRQQMSLESIPVGFFHNMSQAAAAEKLLRLNPQRALPTGQILDAFRQGGMAVASKNAATILYTALKRSTRFERVAGKAWGLAEWYPEKKKRRDADSASSEEE